MANSNSINDSKLVLVMGDGAIRAGFVAGAVGRLVQQIPSLLSKLALVYGASASAGNAAYLTGFSDGHPGEKMWTEQLADERFIRKGSIFSDGPIYDIEYLVEQIFRANTPLECDGSTRERSIGIVFPALELGTNRVRYYADKTARSYLKSVRAGELRQLEGLDIYRLIGAASAAPFVWDRPFHVDGCDMVDAAPVAPSIDDLEFNDPTLKYLFVFCRQPPNLKSKLKYFFNTLLFIAFALPFRKRRFPVRHYMQYALKPWRMERAFRNAFALQKRGRAVVIHPETTLGKIDDNSAENLIRNYRLGEKGADKALSEVRALLGNV